MKNRPDYYPVKTYRPKNSITCRNGKYIERENEGRIRVKCDECRDRRSCMNEA